MAEYILNKSIGNDTNIKIETNDRDFFFKIEKTIQQYLSDGNENKEEFTNEDKITNGNEEKNEKKNEAEIELIKNRRNEQNPPKSIKTKYGNAYLSKGYYRISSMKYRGQQLHRLIYQDYHKCTIISGHIHHIDGNKLNNSPENLILLTPSEHAKITQTSIKYNHHGEVPLLPRNVDDDDYWNLSNDLSEQRNSVGYLHVYKQVCPNCSQGFTYKYTWRENNKLKTLESVDIKKLEAKVRARGLPWKKLI